jgi:hypothetical protein
MLFAIIAVIIALLPDPVLAEGKEVSTNAKGYTLAWT